MKIGIASGKGGTGKTTIATNMALSLGEVQLLDCDVEEPNSGLFLKIDMKKIEDVTIRIPVIDNEKCSHCRKCSNFCQYNAIAVLPSDVLLFPELCHGCGGCTIVCPENAISEGERVIGAIEGGSTGKMEFLQGRMNVGEAMATPVIRTLKRRIEDERTVILDSRPGTACPVIETIGDVDFCILVTEPTPFGLHDLKLAIDVVVHLGVPYGVIINRDGMGDGKVEEFCAEKGIPVIMKIPHSLDIARLYSDGIPFVLEMPEWKAKFGCLLKDLEEGRWA